MIIDKLKIEFTSIEYNKLGFFEDIWFPTVRSMSATTLASDLVSVHPMNPPIGRSFYINITPIPEDEMDEYIQSIAEKFKKTSLYEYPNGF